VLRKLPRIGTPPLFGNLRLTVRIRIVRFTFRVFIPTCNGETLFTQDGVGEKWVFGGFEKSAFGDRLAAKQSDRFRLGNLAQDRRQSFTNQFCVATTIEPILLRVCSSAPPL
jgi:hypothetical protein